MIDHAHEPPAPVLPDPISPYDQIGGAESVRRITERFYDILSTSEAAADIRRMHATDLGPVRQKLFEFMSGYLGGPNLYFARGDSKCMMSAHAPFAIGLNERNQWLSCMHRSLTEAGIAPALQDRIEKALFRFADALRRE